MTTIQKIEAAKYEVHVLDEGIRGIYAHGAALRQLVQEKDREILSTLSFCGWPDPFNVMADASIVIALTTSAPMVSLPILKELLRVCEASQEFQTACQIIEPMLEKVAALEAEADSEAAIYAGQLNAIRDAEEAAAVKASIALDKDPALAKLRAAAETARPAHIEPPPFRGKVELANIG